MTIKMEHSILFVCKEIEQGASEIQIIPFGEHHTKKGTFIHDSDSQKLVISNFSKLRRDTVVDYEHQTLDGSEAPAAGWIKSGQLLNKGEQGTWAHVDWNLRAQEYIKNKEYRYVSPVIMVRNSDKRVVELINVALTNQPNIDGMTPIINKLNLFSKEEKKKMKELMRLLGLGEDSSEEQAIEKLKALLQSIEENKKEDDIVANKVVCEALGLKEKASESEVKATIMAMKQGNDNSNELSKKVKDLTQKISKMESNDLVEMAMKLGKVAPAQKDWATEYAMKDAEGFKLFVKQAPVVVPVGNITENNKKTTKKNLDDAQVSVNKMLGVSEESFRKFSGVKQETS